MQKFGSPRCHFCIALSDGYLCAGQCGQSYCSCVWCDRGREGSAGLWGFRQEHCCCDLPRHAGWRCSWDGFRDGKKGSLDSDFWILHHPHTTAQSPSFLTCSRWKRYTLCTWRASCRRGGPCSVDAGSACSRSWTRRTHRWGRRLADCQLEKSHQVSGRKTFDCGRPAGSGWAADGHPLAPGMMDLRRRQRKWETLVF